MDFDLNNLFKEDSSMFGLKTVDNRIYFYAPKTLIPNTKNKNELIKTVISYCQLLKNSYSTYEENNFFKENNQIGGFYLFEGFIRLVNEFQSKGNVVITERRNRKTKSMNKINWSATLNRCDCNLVNGNIFFNEFITKETITIKSNEWTKLYYNFLNKALTLFAIEERIPAVEIREYRDEEIFSILENQCEKNNGKEQERIEIISEIIRSITLNQNGKEKENIFNVCFHTSFCNIWEMMIDKIIHKNYKVEDKTLPKSKYIFFNKKTSRSGMNPLIDHIAKKGNKIVVIDSKFYNTYENPNSRPSTDDIVKQANYLKMIKEKLNNKSNIYSNTFIFPKNNIEEEKPEYFGVHQCESSNDYEIKLIALDVKKVINCYQKEITYDEFNELLFSI